MDITIDMVRCILEFLCIRDVCNFRQTCKQYLEDDTQFGEIWQNEFIPNIFIRRVVSSELVGFSLTPTTRLQYSPFGITMDDIRRQDFHHHRSQYRYRRNIQKIEIGPVFNTWTLEDGLVVKFISCDKVTGQDFLNEFQRDVVNKYPKYFRTKRDIIRLSFCDLWNPRGYIDFPSEMSCISTRMVTNASERIDHFSWTPFRHNNKSLILSVSCPIHFDT